MDKAQIYERCKFLFLCLQFTRGKTTFKPGERIMINQEIASLLHKFHYSDASHRKVSDKIESKLQQQKELINRYEWSHINEFPYDEILK